MARVTTEDCLERIENRFLLVQLATKRARQLMQNGQATVRIRNKPLVTALREIAAGNVHFDADIKRLVKLNIQPAPPKLIEPR